MTSEVLLTASYDGIHVISSVKDRNECDLIHAADQSKPKGNRGASEIAVSEYAVDPVLGTIEPWHGNQVVVTPLFPKKSKKTRQVIDDHLRWGHAVKWGDLMNDHSDWLIAGVRDNPDPKQGDTFTEKRGVRVYRCLDIEGKKWERYILEDGGVAVEDLAVADLNGDGKPDIIAVGRATQNCRIYWNQGK